MVENIENSYHPSVKLLIVAFVAILSGFFFWNTTQRFLYPSKASQSSIRIFFNQDVMQADANGSATVDVFIAGDTETMPDTATIPLHYNPSEVEFTVQNDSFADGVCRSNGWGYDQSSILTFEPETGNLIVAKTKNEIEDSDGIVCWGSYVFMLKPGVFESTISFGSQGWELKSGGVKLDPDTKESNQIVIKR